MKLLLVILGVVAVATAELLESEVGNEPITLENYHEKYGIPEAARIKASESALDFDGSRIAGGSRARLGQFPSMGGLVVNLQRGQSVCGSSLISTMRAVTAAHCWNDGRNQARQFTVVLGSITLFSGGTRINTNQIVMHPNWNHRTAANDVAVIRFNAVTLTNNIRTIGLATGAYSFAGTTAVAVGFGRKGDNVNIASNQPLSYVNLQVITNEQCSRTFNQIQASNICISGANGRSTCPGDSGGPLARGNTLIGITSFGAAAGCTRGHPAAFARVTSFTNWIRGQ